MDELRMALERLCLEYQGLKYIVKYHVDGENPRVLLDEYCSLPANVSRVSRLFDGTSEDQQSLEPSKLAEALIKVLTQVTP